MKPLAFTLLVRDVLLQRSLPPAMRAAANTLRQRIYRAAVALVPPSSTALRSIGAPARRADGALLADFLRGNASAIEELMARHLPWMQDWARKHLPPHEVEDAVQEAFIGLIQKAPTLQLQAPLRGYLFGFLRIAVLRALRSLSRRRGEPLEDAALDTLTNANPSPEAALLTQRSHAEFAEALERSCNLREQEVILFTLEGQDDRTIASALDITENYVRVLRHRALAKLREALAPSPAPAPPGASLGR
jgi:RNA polymerase sigma-70 factor (ECF subfamily)